MRPPVGAPLNLGAMGGTAGTFVLSRLGNSVGFASGDSERMLLSQ